MLRFFAVAVLLYSAYLLSDVNSLEMVSMGLYHFPILLSNTIRTKTYGKPTKPTLEPKRISDYNTPVQTIRLCVPLMPAELIFPQIRLSKKTFHNLYCHKNKGTLSN